MAFSSKLLAGVFALALTAGSALADTFSFSYVLDDGTHRIVSGVLTGNQVGDSLTGYVTNVAVDSLTFDGISFAGPIENSTRDASQLFAPYGLEGSAIVSFALAQNNFIFIDQYFENGQTAFTNEFHLNPKIDFLNYEIPSAAIVETPNVLIAGDGETGIWTLKNLTHPVPDTGATLALLGLALVGLAWWRRAGRFEAR